MGILPVFGLGVLLFLAGKFLSSRGSSLNRDEVDFENESSDDQKETDKFVQEEIKKEEIRKLPTIIKAPSFISNLQVNNENEAWTNYVQKAKTAGQTTITPNYNLGLFGLNMRTLEDFGYAKNVKKQNYNGRKVWMGDFVEPLTLDKFLSDASIQYEIFLKNTKRHLDYVQKKYGAILYKDSMPLRINIPMGKGATVEEKVPTLSGLLAVAKFAGLSGLDKWMTGNRKEATTKVFLTSNGIF